MFVTSITKSRIYYDKESCDAGVFILGHTAVMGCCSDATGYIKDMIDSSEKHQRNPKRENRQTTTLYFRWRLRNTWIRRKNGGTKTTYGKRMSYAAIISYCNTALQS